MTLEEYQSAFLAFEKCANDGGDTAVVVDSTDEVTGLIVYGTRGELNNPGPVAGDELNICYQTHFSYVELVWQRTDPVLLADSLRWQTEQFEGRFRPCLEANGVDVPASVVPGTPDYGDLTVAAMDLFATGACD